MLLAVFIPVRLGILPREGHYLGLLGVAWAGFFAGWRAGLRAAVAYSLASAFDLGLPGSYGLWALLIYTGTTLGMIGSQRHETQDLKGRLATFRRASVVLHSELDMDKLFHKYATMVVEELGFGDAAIMILDDEECLRMRASVNYSSPGRVLRPGEGICWDAVKSGTTVVTRRCSEDPRYVLGVAGAQTQISVPISMAGKVAGVLVVESTEADDPSPDDIAMLEALSDQAAVAMEKAGLIDEARMQATMDGLTGVANHLYFKERLKEEAARVLRSGGEFSVLMLDVNDLKTTNDRFGHTTGDWMLQAFARILRTVTRESDVVARYGGDEFAVLAPGSGREEALSLAQRIEDALAQGQPGGLGGAVRLSACMGVAVCPGDAIYWEDLVNVADARLYQAKRAHKREKGCTVREPPAVPGIPGHGENSFPG